jgi:mono/diheme cytochrome c family protein
MADETNLRRHAIRPGRQHHLGRIARLFAALAILFGATLALAPLRPYFAEWRGVQHRYNVQAVRSGNPTIPIAIQQIWKPAQNTTDRCITCHIAMGTSAAVPGDRLFAAHPSIPHDPREFGCTVCHGGQGRATTRADAHGFVSHWDEQLLDPKHLTAGCGTCHDRFPGATRARLTDGAQTVERLDCLSCHKLDGRGRGDGPDLTYVGIRGFDSDWPAGHLARHDRGESEAWKSNYGPVSDSDLQLLDVFLRTRVGAPRLIEAQAFALERGCLGCHKIGGRGGDEGPALDAVGRKPAGDFDFSRLRGPATVANYLRSHFLDPASVMPGSLMPAQSLTADEADLLTTYVLFLRSRDLPTRLLPEDRVRRTLLGESGEPMTGSETFAAFCSGCHGPRGEGRNYGNLDVRFPAIGSADFLNVATDEFIRKTLETGRPGRRMPAFGAPASALTGAEVTAVIGQLRSLAPPAPARDVVAAASGSETVGAATYQADCAACHGGAGEGTSLGPALATGAASSRSADAAYDDIVIGRPQRGMPAYTAFDAVTLRSLLDHIRRLPNASGASTGWKMGAGNASRGQPIYAAACAGCHGAEGQGGIGPALANPGFRAAADLPFVAATIVRGRSGTPMPAFGRGNVNFEALSPDEVLDVATYVLTGLNRNR